MRVFRALHFVSSFNGNSLFNLSAQAALDQGDDASVGRVFNSSPQLVQLRRHRFSKPIQILFGDL